MNVWCIEVFVPGHGWRACPGITPQPTKIAAYKEAIRAFGAEWWLQFLTGKHTLRVKQQGQPSA